MKGLKRLGLGGLLALTLAGVAHNPWRLAAQETATSSLPPAETETNTPATGDAQTEVKLGPIKVGVGLDTRGGDMPLVKVGHNARLMPGDQVPVMVVIFGDAVVDGDVDEQLVVVWGDATVNGRVGGECVSVFGSLKLGPKAEIGGQCVVVGGELARDPGARLAEHPVEIGFAGAMKWLGSGLFLARPIVPGIWWVWAIVGVHFVVYFLVALLVPKPVESCTLALRQQPLLSLGAGLAGFILAAPVLLLVTATGVGLLVVPLLVLAFAGAIVVGKTATFQFIGLQVLERFAPSVSLRSLAAFLLGFVVVTVLYMIPILGFITWGVLLALGLGGALMACVEVLRRTAQKNAAAAAVPAGTGLPAATPGVPGAFVQPGMGPGGLAGSAELASLPRTGFWIRFAATVLDAILFGLLSVMLNGWILPLWFAYHIGMWTWKGTTVGGIVCGLKVIRLDGRPLDFTVALVRSLAAIFSLLPLGIGFFWAGWSPERQSWHDKIAGTVIVKVPKGVSLV